MRLYKMFGVWMFEKQTEEERRRSYLGDNREYWFALSNESLRDWSISVCKSFKQNQSCFLVCFAMVQVMLSLWTVFIESLGSNSRCGVSNGVMPCVLGPTSFYLKFWANILISDELQNVVAFMMIFIWVHHVLHLGSSYMNEHMKFWACHMLFIWISGQ